MSSLWCIEVDSIWLLCTRFYFSRYTFVLKRFRLVYERGEDVSLGHLCLSSYAHYFWSSSTIFYHITRFRCDLCRVCSEFPKFSQVSALWFWNKIHKIIINYPGVFRYHVHHNARDFVHPSVKSYFVQGYHTMFNWHLIARLMVQFIVKLTCAASTCSETRTWVLIHVKVC